ncbi:choice-of-anchor D domain-containing protein [Actinoplanes sp. NPDC049599]|uniref:choice-of-anchor D domain-containing protein n=1 Tax=Actinoplanes sp. NPDC049599 TaxID=3363903 RepID=UPI0037AAF537
MAFRPRTSGLVAGSVIVDGGTADGPAGLALEGTGVAAPIAVVAPIALDFGAQPLGTRGLTRGVSVTNDGAADLHITGVSITGPDAADFPIVTDNAAGATLGPEDTAGVDIAFRPAATGGTGVRRASVAFTDDAAGSPRSAELTGTATAPPAVTVDPTAVHFTPRPVGESGPPQLITLTNNGTAPVTVTGVAIVGPAPDDFTVRHTCGAGPQPPGGTCTIEVAFRPTTDGPRSAALAIERDGAATAVPLTGTGLGGTVTFDPARLDFGAQPVGSFSARQDVLLINAGGAALTLTAISVTGDFRYSHTCGSVLGPQGGFCRVSVIFQPTAPGVRGGAVTVTDGLGIVHTAVLTGTGVQPRAALSTAALAFGVQPAGTAAQQTLRLTNLGAGPLIVAAVTIDGDTAFSATGGPRTVLMQGESEAVDITFAPPAPGPYAAALSISTNAPDSPHTVTLHGAAG